MYYVLPHDPMILSATCTCITNGFCTVKEYKACSVFQVSSSFLVTPFPFGGFPTPEEVQCITETIRNNAWVSVMLNRNQGIFFISSLMSVILSKKGKQQCSKRAILNHAVLFMRREARSCLEYLSVCLRDPESQKHNLCTRLAENSLQLLFANVMQTTLQIVFAHHSDVDHIY